MVDMARIMFKLRRLGKRREAQPSAVDAVRAGPVRAPPPEATETD